MSRRFLSPSIMGGIFVGIVISQCILRFTNGKPWADITSHVIDGVAVLATVYIAHWLVGDEA